MSEDLKDTGVRVVKTFVAAAVAVFPADLTNLTDLGVVRGIGLAGLTAAVTLVINVLGKWSASK